MANLNQWILLLLHTVWVLADNNLPYYYHVRPTLKSVKVIESPLTSGLFGYSAAYFEKEKRLYVGAPMIDKVGKVHKCDIDEGSCEDFENIEETNVNSDADSIIYKHNFCLGASLKSRDNVMVTCAPRYTILDSNSVFQEEGHCYKKQPNSAWALMHTPDRDNSTYLTKKKGHEYSMDSLGWSIEIAPKHILTGGPAMATGRAVKYTKSINNGIPDYVMHSTDLARNKIYYNFGYSITSGEFIKTRKTNFAISSTYGENGEGAIMIFPEDGKNTMKIKNSNVGTLFGAVLCAVKIRGKLSSLFVGAPAYANGTGYDRGAVYVYESDGQIKGGMSLSFMIYGKKDGARFGSSIETLGDIDGDKLDEVAIAAPYEDDGVGAVYIYSGADLNLRNPEPKQRIQLENHKAFGFNLVPIKDYDNDGVSELAITAPGTIVNGSDKIFIIRAMPFVTIQLYSKLPDIPKRENETFFVYEVCFNTTYPKTPKIITGNFRLTAQISHKSAKFENLNSSVTLDYPLVNRAPTTCKSWKILTPSDGLYDTPIMHKASIDLLDDPSTLDDFNASRIRLHEDSKLSIDGEIMVANCANVTHCNPEFEITEIKLFSSPYKIGINDTEPVAVIVTNTGETAYQSCVKIHLSLAKMLSTDCQCDNRQNCNEVTCNPTRGIGNGSSWDTGTSLIELGSLDNTQKEINVTVLVYNHCSSDLAVSETISIKLINDYSGLEIEGWSDPGDVVDMVKTEMESLGKQFTHMYKILNRGKMNWVGLSFKLTLHNQPHLEYFSSEISVNHGEKNLAEEFCTRDMGTNNETIVMTCSALDLRRQEEFGIRIPIKVKPGILDEDYFSKNNATAMTELFLYVDETYNTTESVTTLIQSRVTTTPWWIILIAVIFAAAILFLFGFILKECGFLNRENKKKLNNLKQEIRRQSIRRSIHDSMRSSNRSHNSQGKTENKIVDITDPNEISDIDIQEINDEVALTQDSNRKETLAEIHSDL